MLLDEPAFRPTRRDARAFMAASGSMRPAGSWPGAR